MLQPALVRRIGTDFMELAVRACCQQLDGLVQWHSRHANLLDDCELQSPMDARDLDLAAAMEALGDENVFADAKVHGHGPGRQALDVSSGPIAMSDFHEIRRVGEYQLRRVGLWGRVVQPADHARPYRWCEEASGHDKGTHGEAFHHCALIIMPAPPLVTAPQRRAFIMLADGQR